MNELIFEDVIGYALKITKNKSSLGKHSAKSIGLQTSQLLEFADPNKVRLLAETLLKLADWMEKK